MAPKVRDYDQILPSNQAVWDLRNRRSRIEWARIIRMSVDQFGKLMRTRGWRWDPAANGREFAKNMLAAPCACCGRSKKVAEMDTRRRCPSCASEADLTPHEQELARFLSRRPELARIVHR